ncbi:phage holin family protein [Streptomyces sp. NPDC005808]|uniref:phage holin family protein n=1 Tax=Streptomyces sp. NPDC005808 TaxID=3364734 RepID=UPI0036AEFBC5
MATVNPQSNRSNAEQPVGELVQRASQQLSQLVRDEMRLAQAEMTRKGRQFGLGGGLFGGAGLVGVLALQALAATVIAALALTLPVWASALIVTGALAAIALVLAVAAKRQISKATPAVPEQTITSVKADAAEIREKAHR